MDEEMDVIKQKLDLIISGQAQTSERLTRIEARNEQTDKNVDDFWRREWPQVTSIIEAHEERIRSVESAVVSLAVLPARLESIDNSIESFSEIKSRVDKIEERGVSSEKLTNRFEQQISELVKKNIEDSEKINSTKLVLRELQTLSKEKDSKINKAYELSARNSNRINYWAGGLTILAFIIPILVNIASKHL